MSEAIKCLIRRRENAKADVTETEAEITRHEEQIAAYRKHVETQSAAIIELNDAIARLGGTGE